MLLRDTNENVVMTACFGTSFDIKRNSGGMFYSDYLQVYFYMYASLCLLIR